MDHEYISEFDLVDRYLMGKLAGEEITQFEEHFVDCVECTDRLTTTKALMDGLRIVAIDRVPEVHMPSPPQSLSSFAHTMSRRAFAVAACVLLLVVLGGAALLFIQVRRFRFEADQARSAATELERRYQEQRQSSDIAEREHKESERELSNQVAQLRTDLESRSKQDSSMAEINYPIFVPSSTRGGEPSSGSTNELSLPRSSAHFGLSLVLEEDRGYKTYRMTIVNGQNQLTWKGSGIRPSRYNSLSVNFNSSLFRPGNYLLTVEGVARDGSASVVGKYRFRVLTSPK